MTLRRRPSLFLSCLLSALCVGLAACQTPVGGAVADPSPTPSEEASMPEPTPTPSTGNVEPIITL